MRISRPKLRQERSPVIQIVVEVLPRVPERNIKLATVATCRSSLRRSLICHFHTVKGSKNDENSQYARVCCHLVRDKEMRVKP